MKRTLAVAVAAMMLAPAAGASGSLEGLKAGAGRSFLGASSAAGILLGVPFSLSVDPPPAVPAAPTEPREPVLQDPKAEPAGPFSILSLVGKVPLAKLLDFHRDMFTLKLGANDWDVSVAGDPAFKNYYLTFARGELLVIRPLGKLDRLRGKGIDIRIDENTAYNFKVSINIFNPIRGSTMKITPISGTSGPRHKIKTGKILDRIKAKSYVFKSGKEYWILYGTDVDPKTNTLADTRSFLFINEAGMRTKAWPLAESELKTGQPTSVDFGGAKFVLTRTEEELTINNGR